MDWIFELPQEIAVVTVSMLPVSELRGAIPLGFYFGMPAAKTFVLAVLGNIIPVIPILFLLQPVTERLRRFRIWKRFFDYVFERTRKNSELIQKYEALGLILFVAIPLPITGAWSGCIAASLFKIRFRYAFMAILMGVLTAGFIVTTLCILGKLTWSVIQ